eukprot:6881105-Pyramimonas_sp.AAC.1
MAFRFYCLANKATGDGVFLAHIRVPCSARSVCGCAGRRKVRAELVSKWEEGRLKVGGLEKPEQPGSASVCVEYSQLRAGPRSLSHITRRVLRTSWAD